MSKWTKCPFKYMAKGGIENVADASTSSLTYPASGYHNLPIEVIAAINREELFYIGVELYKPDTDELWANPENASFRWSDSKFVWNGLKYKDKIKSIPEMTKFIGRTFNSLVLEIVNVERGRESGSTFLFETLIRGYRVAVRIIFPNLGVEHTRLLWWGRVVTVQDITDLAIKIDCSQEIGNFSYEIATQKYGQACPLYFGKGECLGDETLEQKSPLYQSAFNTFGQGGCNRTEARCSQFDPSDRPRGQRRFYQGQNIVTVIGQFIREEIVKKKFLFFWHKTTRTRTPVQWSSKNQSDNDDVSIGMAFGRVRVDLHAFTWADIGTRIIALMGAVKGQIEGFYNVTCHNPALTIESVTQHLGELGGVGTQQADGRFVQSGENSKLAYVGLTFTGSPPEDQPEEVPSVSSVLKASLIPVRDRLTQTFRKEWNNNPVWIARALMLNFPYTVIKEAWLKESKNQETADYCFSVVEDDTDAEIPVISGSSQQDYLNDEFARYRSTNRYDASKYEQLQGSTVVSGQNVHLTEDVIPGINAASAFNGAIATATSTMSGQVPLAANNGVRHTNNSWGGADAGWNSVPGLPQTWMVDFGTIREIERIDIFHLADALNYNTDPLPTDEFTLYGLVGYSVDLFVVEPFDTDTVDGAWVNIADVTKNVLVWNTFTFAPVTATKLRVVCTESPDDFARLVEVEAWTTPFGHQAANVVTQPVQGLEQPDIWWASPIGASSIGQSRTYLALKFTCNLLIKEGAKLADVLFGLVFPTFRGYMRFNHFGEVEIDCRKPADNTFLRATTDLATSVIPVASTVKFNATYGYLLIGVGQNTAEVAKIRGIRYVNGSAGISVTAAGSGITVSPHFIERASAPWEIYMNFSGVPVAGDRIELKFTDSLSGQNVLLWDYVVDSGLDSLDTIVQMFKTRLMASPSFREHWTADVFAGFPYRIVIRDQTGYLELDRPLTNVHYQGEEVLRVIEVYEDGRDPSRPVGIRDNMKDFVLGVKKHETYHGVTGTYISAVQDFRETQIQPRIAWNAAEEERNLNLLDLDLRGVDNYRQAAWLTKSATVDFVDGNLYSSWKTGIRGQFHEEGEVVAVRHQIMEKVSYTPFTIEELAYDHARMETKLLGKLYLSAAFDERVAKEEKFLEATLTTNPNYQTTPPPILTAGGYSNTGTGDGAGNIRQNIQYETQPYETLPQQQKYSPEGRDTL